MLGGIAFDRERLAGAAADEMIAATDVADLLVRRGVPFRQSHGIVAGLVREARRRPAARSPSSRARSSRATREALDDEFYDVLSQRVVAGVEGLRGRHRAGRACASSSRTRGPSSTASRLDARRRAFYEPAGASRSRRDLLGCVVRHGDTARRDRRDRGLPRVRAGLPRVRRA